jgi:hypothetical protein
MSDTPEPAVEDILRRAHARQRRLEQEQAEAERWQHRSGRLSAAFARVRCFASSVSARELGRQATELEFAQAYTPLLLELGRELAANGELLSRCPEELRSGGDDAKAYALAILRQAVRGDAAEVTRLLVELWHAPSRLREEVTDWLHRGLEREIMGYKTLAQQGPDGVLRPVRQEWETDEEWSHVVAAFAGPGQTEGSAASDAGPGGRPQRGPEVQAILDRAWATQVQAAQAQRSRAEGETPLRGEPVETVAEFLGWIDHELGMHALLGKGRGGRRSDGRLVRNAFCLAAGLGLASLPAEPVGPFTLHEELEVLRNVRRLCPPPVGGSSPATAASDDRHPVATNGPAVNHPEPGRAGKAPGPTAEERVARCLADNAGAWLEDVMRITQLSQRKIQRTRAWKDYEESRLDDYFRANPEADTGDVQKVFHISRAKTVGLRAWRDHQARRQAARPRPRVQERPLTAAIEACHVAGASPDPAERMADREQIFRGIMEAAGPETRARLNGLTAAGQEELVDHLLASMDGAPQNGDKAALAVLLEVASSWLTEREQEGRWAKRRGRQQPP